MQKLIRVTVGSGMFSSERIVRLQVGGKEYVRLVDDVDVVGDKLRVDVIHRYAHNSLVLLPGIYILGTTKVLVPNELLG